MYIVHLLQLFIKMNHKYFRVKNQLINAYNLFKIIQIPTPFIVFPC